MAQSPTSVLSDGTILELVEEGRIRIEPWDPRLVQPASVDLRLGDSFRVFHNHRASAIDLRTPPAGLTEEVVVPSEESFVIHPGEFCLGRTLEWVELPDDVVARIEGKALSLDTELPTPDGWRTMGELEVGDWVLGRGGRPTPVIAMTQPMLGRTCRTIGFSDGATVIADVEHRWPVSGPDGSRRILTTGEIERTLERGGSVRCLQRERSSAEGTGTARRARAARGTCGAGHDLLKSPNPLDEGRLGRLSTYNLFQSTIRAPEEGFALLSTLAGRPDAALSPDARPWPAAALPPGHARGLGGAQTITAVRRCESVPVRCIEVAAPDGIFLITRSFIPTHNSSLGRLGLIVHATAGFCDPGWKGTLTLELNNLTRVPIKLYPGLPIAQLSFMTLDKPARRPYGSAELGSHYQGQRAATESRYEGLAGKPSDRGRTKIG
jgi:deoxycytidine triphosphate deaminase